MLHKFFGIIASFVTVCCFLSLHLAPNYVKSKGYLLHAESLFQVIPLWVPTLAIILVNLGILWTIWRIISEHFQITSMYHYRMIVSLILSCVGIYLVTTNAIQQYLLLGTIASIIYYLYGLVDVREEFITPKIKSYRRMAMMVWSVVAFGFSATVYALHLFFEMIPFLWLVIVLSAIFSWITYEVLNLYIHLNIKKNWFWFLLVWFFMFEVIWIIQLLPFVYITLGFFVTWIWYVLQLLLRFHFSKTGIEWKKQQAFLLTNIILFVTVLILLEWQ